MNNTEKIDYLNLFLDVNQGLFQKAREMYEKGASLDDVKLSAFSCNPLSEKLFSQFPNYLYKYRPFDKYTVEMIEQGYLFLCKANRLNDDRECTVDLSTTDGFDAVNEQIKPEFFEAIIDYVSMYAPKDQKNMMRDVALRCVNSDYTINRAKLLDYISQTQEYMPQVQTVAAVNCLAQIPDLLFDEENKKRMKALFDGAANARETIGLCSLSERPDNEHMWKEYAANDSGYCIEYDFGNDYQLSFMTLPVVYSDIRNNNIVDVLIHMLLPEYIKAVSHNRISPDRSSYLRLFLTKEERWSIEEEWRVIGEADTRAFGPKIKRVFVGKNASKENKKMMLKFGANYHFEVIFR